MFRSLYLHRWHLAVLPGPQRISLGCNSPQLLPTAGGRLGPRIRKRLWEAELYLGFHLDNFAGSRNVTQRDRKSTRLNSSHLGISYAVFCLKKKKNNSRPSPTYTLALSS